MEKPTTRQGYAIFRGTGYDIRETNITKDQARQLIGKSINGEDISKILERAGAILRNPAKKKTLSKHDIFKALYEKAYGAGMVAGNESVPTPMVVSQHKNMLDDNSEVVKSYYVEGGVCGFAWISIKPGNCSFANWLKKNDKGSKDSYYGGVTVWVHEFGQSMTRKMAFASAFASVISDAGINAFQMSRMD